MDIHLRLRPAGRRASHRARRSVRSLVLGVAAALGVVTLGTWGLVQVTSAAYNDTADLNVGNGTAASGIGSPDRFDLGIVRADNVVIQADAAGGADWVVPGAATLVPGHSVTTDIPVFNNTPKLRAATTFKVVLRNTDGTVAGRPNITPFLRFTAKKADGTVLFTGKTYDQATASLGTLGARGAAALVAGATYSAGAAGASDTVTLTITYLDVAGVEALNGGQSAVSVRFDATSVSP